MKILDALKEHLNWKDLTDEDRDAIVEELDAQIEEIRTRNQVDLNQERDEEHKASAERIKEARARQHRQMNARKKLRHEAGISPARLIRLRKLGKI